MDLKVTKASAQRTKQSGFSAKKPELHRKNNLAFIYEIRLCFIKNWQSTLLGNFKVIENLLQTN